MRRRMMHVLSAQAHKLSISHCKQVHELLITAATTTYVNDKILRASAQGIHIASYNSDDNNNGNDDDECQQFSYCVTQWRQQKQLLAMTNNERRTTRPRAQGHNILTSRRATAMMTTITVANSTKLTMKPCTSHRQTGNNNKAMCACARHAGCIAQWRRQYGLMRLHTTCRLRPTMATMIWPCAQAHNMLVALHDGDDNNNSGDKDKKVNEYHHTLCARAPGFQPLCASTRATASNIDATTN